MTPPRKRGGQSKYNAATAELILERLAAGASLLEICNAKDMPAESTVRGWALDDVGADPAIPGSGFAARYTRARDIGLDHEADEIKLLADTCRIGDKIETREVGRLCSLCSMDLRWRNGKWTHSLDGTALCDGAEADKVTETKTVTGDMVERTKLQIDARKWRLSKMAPKRYGDRVTQEISGPGGGEIPTKVTIEFV